jgi:lipopolysaccharide/colanic/teichoic acid biosynthesis glycosyltransferase
MLLKRTLDIGMALAGLVVFAVVLPAVVIAIRLSSPGPVLFRQERVGRNGVPFTIYKLRTMHVGMPPVTHGTERPQDDPRIHAAGRFMRKTSLDELPQLINVLKGDMSIVGPRPFVPAESAQMPLDLFQRRCTVRPGLTGPWQISDRQGLSWEQTAQLDCEYAANYNLRRDLAILVKTPVAALKNR